MRWRAAALCVAAAVLLTGLRAPALRQTPAAADARERAYRANNLGVAQLEQYNYEEATRAFRQALTIDPELAIARLNLGLALLYAGNAEEAVTAAQAAAARLPQSPQAHYVVGLIARAQGRAEDAATAFRRVLQIDPSDAGSRINLGQILIQQRAYTEAVTLFREALAAEPYNVTAAYGLATALTRAGSTDDGRAAMQRFESLRDAPYAVTYAQTYLEQGRYGEAIASTGAEADLVDPATPAVTFVDATETALPPSHTLTGAAAASDAPSLGSLTLADIDGDGDLDAYAVDLRSSRLYLNSGAATGRLFTDVTAARGLAFDPAATATGALVGDVDNDRRADILLLPGSRARLLHQRADGRFEDVTAKAGLPSAPGRATSGAFVDIDHDGDLDILIAAGDATPAQLLRNNGDGTFADVAGAAGMATGATSGVATAPTDFDNRRDVDVLLLDVSGAPRLFKNMRDGSFTDVAGDVGLSRQGTFAAVTVGDVNKDGFPDFFFAPRKASGVLMLSDGHGRFVSGPAPELPAGASVVQFVDYDNDGLLDLFAMAERTPKLFRNLGGRWADVSEAAGLPALALRSGDVRAIAFGDVDRDGDTDALLLTTSGEVRFWRNDGGNTRRSLAVPLTGRVSNRFGVGSKIDLRAGSLRQRLETSAATPAIAPADVLFGLGARASADVVRVIWPSGTMQAETAGTGRTLPITELDRKPSSCPFLYTWNGTRFDFVTDFMGGGEMGYWEGPGTWNAPDPDEYVRIPPGRLVPRNGRYELRVTNELEEALFVDRLELVAVDHAAGVAIFPTEGLGAPNVRADGTLLLTTTQGARPVAAARDEHGHDVTARLRDLDGRAPDDFATLDIRGYAETHDLVLDLGAASGQAVLLATAWTDYAFSSDNLAAHQRALTLTPPSLDARTPSGTWRPVIEDIGIPVGRPQTVVVDLRGKLHAGEREVRIRTNMRIYWDQILVDASGGGAPTRVTRLDPSATDLHWRGFSAEIAPVGHAPLTYDYTRVSRTSPWKTMVGRYTREGDVRELLRAVDDMFVIARTGDEIALSFDASALPPLDAGRTRTFLLYAHGFSKEMDITSATPDAVEPLPFRAMRRYPYGDDEHYPRSEAHRQYQATYNTRVVARPLPPLETSGAK